jgi:hypothetical protein
MQTKFKIVETVEYYLAVSDINNTFFPESAIVKDYAYNHKLGLGIINVIYGEACFQTIKRHDKDGSITIPWQRNLLDKLSKVIAYLPKNNAPELDLPLLPEIIIKPRGFDEFQYTEQDMINLARNISYEWYSEKLTGILDSAKWTDNYLQSLKQSKTPTHFEADVKFECCNRYLNCVGCDATHDVLNLKLKTELINGKETLVGNYLFE